MGEYEGKRPEGNKLFPIVENVFTTGQMMPTSTSWSGYCSDRVNEILDMMPDTTQLAERLEVTEQLLIDAITGHDKMLELKNALAEQNEKMLGVLKHIYTHLGDSSKLSYIRVTLDNTIAEIEAE